MNLAIGMLKLVKGLLHDAYICFTALFCDSTEEIAEKAVEQHKRRKN